MRNTIIAVALCLGPLRATAEPLRIGLVSGSGEQSQITSEWSWALKGGGAELVVLPVSALRDLSQEVVLLILDAVPLDAVACKGLARWTESGGLLVAAGAEAALQQLDETGVVRPVHSPPLGELLGIRYAGIDPGLRGTYPYVVADSALLGPLAVGDGARLGKQGIAEDKRIEARGAEVLARSARLSPGPGGPVLLSSAPTILTRKVGQGRTVFLSFSPGRVAACYPDGAGQATDCTGAGTARALMRWLVASLLWEERRLQLPLPFESPGSRPHSVLITGDVHDDEAHDQIRSARQMGEVLAPIGIRADFFLVGRLASSSPDVLEALRQMPLLTLGPHSSEGAHYRPGQIEGPEGVRQDFRRAEQMLGLPSYPEARRWLVAFRSEGWSSDETRAGAWRGLWSSGVGLVFDHNADSVFEGLPGPTAPSSWFTAGNERQRLFVPVFERSVATGADQFRLGPELERDLASLGSPEPDPCCNLAVTYEDYTGYVERWHELFGRLSLAGGLVELWLWHPSTPAWKGGFEGMAKVLTHMREQSQVQFVRSADLATWRANRDRLEIRPVRDPMLRIEGLELLPPRQPLFPLPPGAAAEAGTVSYWVFGPALVPGWQSTQWLDATGRPVTVLVRPIPGAGT